MLNSPSRLVPCVAMAASAIVIAVGIVTAFAMDRARGYHPHLDPADFQMTVDNPWFPLVPGTRFVYVEKEGGRTSEDEVTVTRETRLIMGVTCIVVHDVLRTNAVVAEETWDWYAQDRAGSVWYFGEDTKEFHPKGKVSTEGSWEAGVAGAQPGLLMPANPGPGAAYRQEYLAGKAEDMGRVMASGETVTVPYGRLTDCIRTREWSMLESGSEKKWYARGVGFVRSESTSRETSELVSLTRP
jgi:hypothetical protein